MNTEQILNYQNVDRQLFKLEQKLLQSPYKKKANELAAIAKKAQAKTLELEAEAAKLSNEIEQIKKNFDISTKALAQLQNANIENADLDELEKFDTLKSKVYKNLMVLEKALQRGAESINHLLAEFNKTKKLYDQARVQFEACKQKIAEETKQIEPEKERVRKELLALEKTVDVQSLAEYKKKRADNIFPVVVPLENGAYCGHCRMELAKVAITRIKEKGVITCEHCKRFIYNP